MHAQQPVEIKKFQSKNNKVGTAWGCQRRLFSLQLEKGTEHPPITSPCSSRVAAVKRRLSRCVTNRPSETGRRYAEIHQMTFVGQIASAVFHWSINSGTPLTGEVKYSSFSWHLLVGGIDHRAREHFVCKVRSRKTCEPKDLSEFDHLGRTIWSAGVSIRGRNCGDPVTRSCAAKTHWSMWGAMLVGSKIRAAVAQTCWFW